jgi:hypothetical protein
MQSVSGDTALYRQNYHVLERCGLRKAANPGFAVLGVGEQWNRKVA